MAKKNPLTRAHKNKAEALALAGQLADAEAAYARVCGIDRADGAAWLARSDLCRRLGRYAEAEEYAGVSLRLNESGEGRVALGKSLQLQGRLADAEAAYRKAAKSSPKLAEAPYLLGNVLRETGRLRDAVDAYRQAIALNPAYIEALGNLGACLTVLGDIQAAAATLNRAVLLMPDSPQILCNLGRILERDGRFAEALDRYERALKHAPGFIDAASYAASLHEKAGRLQEAEALVAAYLPRQPESVQLLLVAAKLARRKKETDAAIALLERVLGLAGQAGETSEMHMLLGQLYDLKGDAARAFRHLQAGNRIAENQSAEMSASGEGYVERVRRLRKYLQPGLREVELGVLGQDDPDAPIFLVGFPRSGTTLLEQILDSHPGLQSLEEKGTVSAMVRACEARVECRETGLLDLTEADVAALRDVYFAEVAKHVKRAPGTRLVDKMPLNTVNVHLIWRMFPRAKFILAIRHPCDACFSCFMQSFLVNEAMANFFTLESGAQIYDEVMRTWLAVVEQLPIDYHRVRYEDLVGDFEGETRALLTFLGVGWDDAVRGHTEHARQRGTISTPSYHQVTQPIYRHARYRWRRYEAEFAGALPLLAPYIRYFGYADDEAADPASS